VTSLQNAKLAKTCDSAENVISSGNGESVTSLENGGNAISSDNGESGTNRDNMETRLSLDDVNFVCETIIKSPKQIT
jgi:hypothetical protein